MPRAEQSVHIAHALLHIGGLSGAGALLAERHSGSAIQLALVATACVLILAGGNALAQIIGVKVRQYVRKRERAPEPHDGREPDA